MIKWQQFWQVKFKGKDLPERAYDQKPDLDYQLQEALTGFYFLSERRKVNVGMTAAMPEHIPLSEIVNYHQIFKPYLDLPHFTRVLSAADRTYLSLIHEEQKNKAKPATKPKKR
jgi:hypothetical protein